MKRSLFLICFLLSMSVVMKAAVKVDRVEPANWFVGMKNPTLQLMMYGQGIKDAEVTTDYPGVRVDSVVALESPNYLLVYLNLSGAQPGTMNLNVRVGKKTKKIAYPLLAREMAGEKRESTP